MKRPFINSSRGGLSCRPVHKETALRAERLMGERARTVNQLRMFAAVAREGSWIEASIDHAEPEKLATESVIVVSVE